MRDNKNVKLMTKIALGTIITLLVVSSIGWCVWYFTEGKLDEDGFNVKGVRELSKDRDYKWDEVVLGTYTIIASYDTLNKCNLTVRKSTYQEVYDYLCHAYYGDFKYLSEETEKKLDKQVREYLDETWKNDYIFHNVTVTYRVDKYYDKSQYIDIQIDFDKNGEISNVYHDKEATEVCDFYKLYVSKYSPIQEVIKLTDTNSDVTFISGSIEKR